VAIRVNESAERPALCGLRPTFPIEQQLRLLIRYAVLAPSVRNSQPWRFTVERNVVGLWADPERRLPVADPARRELYLSLGCALENLVVAAECAGYRHEIVYFPDRSAPDLASRISFHPDPTPGAGRPPVTALETLELRRTALRPFIARQIPPRVLDRLRAVRTEPAVRVDLSDGAERRRKADVLSVRAVATLFGDQAYRQEVLGANGSWKLTLAHGEPARRLAQQISALIRSAPVIGVIGSVGDSPVDHVRSGRLLERLWLAATAEGLALQPISFALQAPSTREALAALFPEAGAHAQHLIRLGYMTGRDDAGTSRRPVEDVIWDGQNGRAAHPA
jgi:nitroreductase